MFGFCFPGLRRRLRHFTPVRMTRKRTFENPVYCGGQGQNLAFPAYEVSLDRDALQKETGNGDSQPTENESRKKVTSARFRPREQETKTTTSYEGYEKL